MRKSTIQPSHCLLVVFVVGVLLQMRAFASNELEQIKKAIVEKGAN